MRKRIIPKQLYLIPENVKSFTIKQICIHLRLFNKKNVMGFWKAISNWRIRKAKSDIKRVKVTSSGAFYMKSEDLFNDKAEALKLLDKLNKSVESRTRATEKFHVSASLR